MPCCETHIVCSSDQKTDLTNECCNPHVRETCKNITQDEIIDENCMRNRTSCSSCCCPVGQECWCTIHHHDQSKNVRETAPEDHLHCVTHSCPLGKVVCSSNCQKSYCINDKDIIKAKDISQTSEGITCYPVYNQEPISEKPCCAMKSSWTEPRICLRDPCDPCGYLKRCGRECGAAIIAEPPKERPKKIVRFADEIVGCEDKKLHKNSGETKYACSCCKKCAISTEERHVGKPELLYEPNFDDTRVQECLCSQKVQPKDPCQKLAEECCSWKKTSNGDEYKKNSRGDERDTDLYKMHFDECNGAHLPPQYQCHGYGHICEPAYHTTEEKFTLCEKGDTGESRYWWKKSCCKSKRRHDEKFAELTPDLMKPVCPPYTTTYQLDFKDPHTYLGEKLYWGNCGVCENFTIPEDKKDINLLCTENTRGSLMTQRAGIV